MEKREIFALIITIILMSLIIIFHDNSLNPIFPIIFSVIIVFVFVISKKITADIIDIEIEHKIWIFQRWWIGKGSYFKKPAPSGAIIPAVLSIISLGFITCFSFLQYEAKALPAKAVKKYGSIRFPNIKEFDLAAISFYGILSLLILSALAKFLAPTFPAIQLISLSKYSLYFAIWNVLPISQLDGAKLFFGSSRLFFFTLILIAASILIFVLP